MTRFSQRFRLTGGSEANSVNKWFGGGFAAETTAFEFISTTTLTTTTASISFTSIPATYTHLQIRGIAQFGLSSDPGGSGGVTLWFNNDYNTNFDRRVRRESFKARTFRYSKMGTRRNRWKNQ